MGMVAAETRGCVAASRRQATFRGLVLMTHQKYSACKQNFHLGGPEKLTGADDPRHALQEHVGLANPWYMDDGDIMCHPILVPSYLHEFDDANAKVGAERHPQKTEVIYCVDDFGAAPPEWKIDEVRKLATVSTVTAGSNTLGGRGTPTVNCRPALGQDKRSNARTCPVVSVPAHRIWSPSLGVSRINHILRVHGHSIFQENRAAAIYDEGGQWSTAWCKSHSAQASSEEDTEARVTLRPQHTWEHSWQQPPPPISKQLMTKTEPRPSCMFRKLPRQQTKRWQQTVDGHNGPSVTNPTVSELEHPSSVSQGDDSDDMDFSSTPQKSRLSAPQL